MAKNKAGGALLRPGKLYMPLREAAELIGKSRFGDQWQSSDVDQLRYEDDECSDIEAWERAAAVEEIIEDLLQQRSLRGFVVTENGEMRELRDTMLGHPFFKVLLHKGVLDLEPDFCFDLFIDGPQLLERLDLVVVRTPRKTKYNWEDVTFKAWEYAFLHQDALTQTAIVTHVQQWHSDKFDSEPDSGALYDLARRIVSIIKATQNKSGSEKA